MTYITLLKSNNILNNKVFFNAGGGYCPENLIRKQTQFLTETTKGLVPLVVFKFERKK